MLVGLDANLTVAPANFYWGTSRHLLVQDGCVNCHAHAFPVVDPTEDNPNELGHTFAPEVKACAPCHGTINDFNDIPAAADYDGNGTVEGLQTEVEGLMAELETAILNASDTSDHRAALLAGWPGTLGDATVTSVAQRSAGYNYMFVLNDKSMGVHNAVFAVKLLQQSIAFLTPPPARMKMLID
jgi:hypothetical protein